MLVSLNGPRVLFKTLTRRPRPRRQPMSDLSFREVGLRLETWQFSYASLRTSPYRADGKIPHHGRQCVGTKKRGR